MNEATRWKTLWLVTLALWLGDTLLRLFLNFV